MPRAGDATNRDEVITTIFSHPSNAACAKTAGYRLSRSIPTLMDTLT